jgi:hypothetical protein
VPEKEPDPEQEEHQDVQRVDRVADDSGEQVSFEETVERVLVGEVDVIRPVCGFFAAF